MSDFSVFFYKKGKTRSNTRHISAGRRVSCSWLVSLPLCTMMTMSWKQPTQNILRSEAEFNVPVICGHIIWAHAVYPQTTLLVVAQRFSSAACSSRGSALWLYCNSPASAHITGRTVLLSLNSLNAAKYKVAVNRGEREGWEVESWASNTEIERISTATRSCYCSLYCYLTSSFAPVMITTDARGRCHGKQLMF